MMQLKVQSLVLDLIHSIDVVEQLQAEFCGSVGQWAWQRQLRYYEQGRGGEVNVQMDNGLFSYSYEYQGNAPRLVYTPLTDKCYLTPPRGCISDTVETYVPLAREDRICQGARTGMGRQVLVFNCDEEFGFKSMGRIFTGLLKGGAWGCSTSSTVPRRKSCRQCRRKFR